MEFKRDNLLLALGYNYSRLMTWLTGVNPNTDVSIMDPYFGLVKDLGTASTFSYNFQAQQTGHYTVKIAANWVYSIGYTVKYTMYS
jgi:hypothetical protein